MGKLFICLVHYPVYNKNMEVISTSITNMDIHDIARTSATYGIEKYYLVHPQQVQHDIIKEILDYWHVGYGGTYNPDRKAALENVKLTKSIPQVINEIRESCAGQVKTIVTDARKYPNSMEYSSIRKLINTNDETNYLLLFGTGWGLAKEVMGQADYRLLPILGKGEYNHLSVRSAVAIILDRLCGEQWW
ncbi:MAG: RNA methyltransferase [Bacillota bacterium]